MEKYRLEGEHMEAPGPTHCMKQGSPKLGQVA